MNGERSGVLCLAQMIEELLMAFLMSVAFSVPVFYLCKLQGSFFVFWLAWLISLADGIGARVTSPFMPDPPPAA